ncbi:hypothetical protein F4780DRAFT_768576 [Xylariomycetidae sp. FL0641]|nr:hypothetical protein F4780DRAFT_768576 [Xylariomycetidae sp. FL0641]
MARPFNSWAHEPYAPRRAPCCPQEPQGQTLRLPPPSSLVSGAQPSPGMPNGRQNSSYTRPPALHRPPRGPAAGPDSVTRPFEFPGSRPSPDHGARLPLGQPPAVGNRTGDLPGRLGHFRVRQAVGDQSSIQTQRNPAQLQPMRTSPPRSLLAEPPPPRPYLGLETRNSSLDHQQRGMGSPGTARTSQADFRVPERMKISGLLSEDPRPETPTSSKAPERRFSVNGAPSAYKIKMRQQPIAARSCGFGERDRRVIDPPPIVEVTYEDPDLSPEEIKERLKIPFAVMHCTIWNEAGDQDCSAMPEDYRQQRRLMGTIVSSPFFGYDEQDKYGCFFCFPDLSCRTPGSFRLKFSLVILDPLSTPGTRTPVCSVVMSDVFTVYNAKDFPGMKASTALTKKLKDQGCLISIKKGNERNRAREESEEDEEDDEDNAPSRQSKRAKRS